MSRMYGLVLPEGCTVILLSEIDKLYDTIEHLQQQNEAQRQALEQAREGVENKQ